MRRSDACSRSATASRVSPGLPNAAVNELLEFEGGAQGLALNLEEETIGAVILGKADEVEEGQLVTATGRILSIPVGDALLGRVVNGLGVAIDGKGPIAQDNAAPARSAGARASPAASRCTSRCRPASRPSTR